MTSENKRQHERIQSLNLSYICLDEKNNIVKQGMGRTLNISESGILLETHFPIELDHLIRLTISLEEDLVDIKGKPIHVSSLGRRKHQIGIKFLDLDQHAADLLKNFISDGGIKNSPNFEEDQ